MRHWKRGTYDGHHELSPAETRILQEIARGRSTREIAAGFGNSPQTIKWHTKHILRKLDARNRAHAVAIGYESGLLGTSSPGGNSSPSPTSMSRSVSAPCD